VNFKKILAPIESKIQIIFVNLISSIFVAEPTFIKIYKIKIKYFD